MKKLLMTFSFLASTGALAEVTPIVTKFNGGGFVPQAYFRSQQCQVFADRVVIKNTFGYANNGNGHSVTTEIRNVKFDGDINAILAAVAKEELQIKGEGPCDAPTTNIVAGKDITLFMTGVCGGKRQERVGTASRMLRDIVDMYCPKTYDFGHNDN